MWKVKRMNTARIVVPAIAVGAGGIAAYPASGSDKPLPVAPEHAGTLAGSRQGSTLSMAPRSIADVNAPEIKTDELTPRRDESINVVRYGANSPTTTQK
jgi:hypothetical protein